MLEFTFFSRNQPKTFWDNVGKSQSGLGLFLQMCHELSCRSQPAFGKTKFHVLVLFGIKIVFKMCQRIWQLYKPCRYADANIFLTRISPLPTPLVTSQRLSPKKVPDFQNAAHQTARDGHKLTGRPVLGTRKLSPDTVDPPRVPLISPQEQPMVGKRNCRRCLLFSGPMRDNRCESRIAEVPTREPSAIPRFH